MRAVDSVWLLAVSKDVENLSKVQTSPFTDKNRDKDRDR